MTEPTAQQAFDTALRHHQAGRLRQAEEIYQQIIANFPEHVDSIHNLGVIALQMGRSDIATVVLRRAVALRPDFADAHSNLGNALLGVGCVAEAIESYQVAVAIRPNFPDALSNLSAALKGAGRYDESIEVCRRAITFRPDFPEAHNNLANSLMGKGQFDEAIVAVRRAIELRPNFAEAYGNLGNALVGKGHLAAAGDAYRQAIALNPRSAEALTNLGTVLKNQERYDESIEHHRQAIAVGPRCAEAYHNLATTLMLMGQLDESIECARQAMLLKPADTAAHDNLICTMLLHPDMDEKTIYQECRTWEAAHALPLQSKIRPHDNMRDSNRKLRVGYVSPDFRDHAVGRNMMPLFVQHNHDEFEVFCYAHVSKPDDLTARFRQAADHWRNIVGLSPAQVAQKVREDQIDILVDLALHTPNNGLQVFAQKPAPVQVTFAGYPGTTGLNTIDYRLSDPFLDPPDADVSVYSEETIRLPHSFWCYDPLDESDVRVNPLPALENGVITFGCLNNFCKVTSPMIAIWASVMNQVKDSRLMLLAAPGEHVRRTSEVFKTLGIDPSRITFAPRQRRREYLQLYHQIDIGLDSFPYNGHTTSLDSFWMGVPVVTLVGQTVVSRAGFCQLSNLGLVELAANTPGNFMRIAVELAGDMPRLRQIRSTLRRRMEQSPLMDSAQFARGIEAAYRNMWVRWCEGTATPEDD